MAPYRVCFVSSELAPIAKTGGLADVAAGLCRDLTAAGHDVRLYMPLYRRVREAGLQLEPSAEQRDIELNFGARKVKCSVLTSVLEGPAGGAGIRVFFVDAPELFGGEELYGGEDEHMKFAVLSRAAIEGCQRMQWAPDLFHCNDWHAALLPLYLRTTYGWDRLFSQTKTLLTIHNIGYQGNFDANVLADLGLMEQRRRLPREDQEAGRLNILKVGILSADALSTVSRTYAAEIQTPEFGMGLQDALRSRAEVLSGIVNGVDYADWDPSSDKLIPHPYSAADLSGKAKNKAALCADFGLPLGERTPVFGIVSRLTGQKGFDLLPDILPILLQRADIRLVVLGSGESDHEKYFQWLRDTWPDKVANYRGYSNELAHRIEAGADLFLMPSRYEPCGLNQMYSLRYGTVPVVRRTGGLADTVQHFDPATGEGTGFVFDDFKAEALLWAMRQALEVWSQPAAWDRLVQNGMAMDYSWERQGREYEQLYARLCGH